VNVEKFLALLLRAFIGWALCGAAVTVGRNITSIENTLIIHAVGVAIIYLVLSRIYFKKFDFTGVLRLSLLE